MPHTTVLPGPAACIIGYPVKHSRSPLIHRFWLREYGLPGRYEFAETTPEDLPAFIRALRDNGFAGGNVTIPHKEAAFRLAERLTLTARALEAANTLWFEDGTLCGDNTDVEGFLANLDFGAPEWDARAGVAVVLGAGGAARAIVYGLLRRGVERVVVVNRTPERVEALAHHFGREFGPGRIAAAGWADAQAHLPESGLVVNTTSLGMHGQPPLEIDLGALPETAVVTDAVYVPLVTPLIAAAAARGLRTVDGLGMLLYQAVPGFEHWFGRRPVVTQALRAHIEADILHAHPEAER
ncbi:shikimate dehydrogenase [Pseudochelatococcus sp. B33]